jgi:hypothetical protein
VLDRVRLIHNELCPYKVLDPQAPDPRAPDPQIIHDESTPIQSHDRQVPDPHDEGFLIQTMDSLELIDDAEDQYVPTTGEQLNEVLSEKD